MHHRGEIKAISPSHLYPDETVPFAPPNFLGKSQDDSARSRLSSSSDNS